MVDGLKIKGLREMKNLTQAELGSLVGAEQSMIGYVERGVKRPSVELLARIAEKLDTTVDELLHKNKID